MDSRGFQEIDLGDLCIKIGSGVTPRGGGNVYKQDGISLIRSQNIYMIIHLSIKVLCI